jgi:hypothetical protein
MRPTLDSLLPDLPPAARPALFPTAPPRRPPALPADWLARAADPAGLSAFDPVAVADPPAAPAEAHAVAAALGCPDLFLVAVPPGPARDRCLLGVVGGAVGRGERVLVLAPTPAEADRLAVLVPAAVRALAAGEHTADLPPAVVDRTSQVHGPDRVAVARRALTSAARDAADRLARGGDDDALARLDAERAARQADLVTLREQLKPLAPLTAARKGGRILTGLFWRSVLAGDVAGRQAELERRVREAEAAVRELDARAERLGADAGLAAAGLALARRCLAELADEAAAARRFLARVRVVVAPPGAAADPAVAVGFDRLVVAAAEAHPEADVRAAARLADRGVLLGSRAAAAGGNGSARGIAGLPGGLFGRAWDRLHRPAWAVADGRLVCRLADVAPGPLCCEPCADRPDIELRFGLSAAGTPVVAEIVFPHAGPEGAADAKAFLARELGEVRLTPCGPARWAEADGKLVVEWPAAGGGVGAEVGPGVCEHVALIDGVPVTTRVVFDPAAGWDRAAASRWVERHAAAARLARTARVPAGAAVPEPEPCLV